MIFGQLDELKFYKGLSSGLDKAIETIESGKYRDGYIGKNEIDGDKVFFNVQECQTKKIENCFFEAHKKYMDIHIILEGEEGIGYSLKNDLKEKSFYDEEKDFMVLEGEEKYRFEMNNKNFLIVFPEEPHMPLISLDNEEKTIKKVVFKIEY